MLLTGVALNSCYNRSRAREIAIQVQGEFTGVPIGAEASERVIRRIRELAGNPFDRGSYEVGYGDGESNQAADWAFALDEFCELPPDVNAWSPTEVAKYIAQLQDRASVE